jgi:hypothetical protein
MFFHTTGWVYKVSAVARDIGVLMQAREALQESERNFKSR